MATRTKANRTRKATLRDLRKMGWSWKDPAIWTPPADQKWSAPKKPRTAK